MAACFSQVLFVVYSIAFSLTGFFQIHVFSGSMASISKDRNENRGISRKAAAIFYKIACIDCLCREVQGHGERHGFIKILRWAMIFGKRMGMQAEKMADEHREKPCKSEIFKKTAAAAVKAVLLCNGVKWAFAGGKKEKNLVCAEKNASKRSKV